MLPQKYVNGMRASVCNSYRIVKLQNSREWWLAEAQYEMSRPRLVKNNFMRSIKAQALLASAALT